jgi:hypothetical protein
MKITFGRVHPDHEYSESFEGIDNKGNTGQFYYKLEINDEGNGFGTFTITDTCDRYMPFDFDQLDELSELINKLKTYRDDKIQFDNYWKAAWGVPE